MSRITKFWCCGSIALLLLMVSMVVSLTTFSASQVLAKQVTLKPSALQPISGPILLASVTSNVARDPMVSTHPNSAVEDLDSERVRNSIQRGVRFLLRTKDGNTWPTGYRDGATGLAALALLNAGVSPDSPELVGTLNYLAVSAPNRTYDSSLIIMALVEADANRFRQQIQEHADFLIHEQLRDGGFGYGRGGISDSSNTQFAILGLHAAQSAGVKVDRAVWAAAKNYWESVFVRRTGGFGYRRSSSAYGSMTCAGVCSLTIIEENLSDGSSSVSGDQIECCEKLSNNPMIDDGIRWLGRNFSALRNPAGAGAHQASALYYYLYSLERTGRLTGRRFFGQHDWYREGAKSIIEKQQGDGSWRGQQNYGESTPAIATSMALLFLSKGLRPILVGKLQHNQNDWDPHPKGIQYLTRFVEKTWDRKLNWQTIDAENARANDLLETPVLHITGKTRLQLTTDQIKQLKEYVDNGGFLFFESENGFGCPDARVFDQDVRNLLSIIVPDAKLEVLKPDHLVWSAQFRLTPDQEFPVLGIQSCCRTSVIYCPSPISGVWQLNKPKANDYNQQPKEKVEYTLKLGTNILAFATGNELKDKLERPKVDNGGDDEARSIGRRIMIPKLRHQSGFDDAPMALSNLLRRVENDRGVEFQKETEFVDADIEQLELHPILFIHGRGKFQLSIEERKALKEHLDRDGFIFGDSICGDDAFYESFKNEMQDIAGPNRWEPVSSTDELYSSKNGGYDLGSVDLRLLQNGRPEKIKTPPRLEAIRMGDRYQVVFSRYDISCAMENGTSTSCYGYTAEDAAKIGTNILLYALQP